MVSVGNHFAHLDAMQEKHLGKQTYVKRFVSENLFIPEALNSTWVLCGSAHNTVVGGGQDLHCKSVRSLLSLSFKQTSSSEDVFYDHLETKYIHSRH